MGCLLGFCACQICFTDGSIGHLFWRSSQHTLVTFVLRNAACKKVWHNTNNPQQSLDRCLLRCEYSSNYGSMCSQRGTLQPVKVSRASVPVERARSGASGQHSCNRRRSRLCLSSMADEARQAEASTSAGRSQSTWVLLHVLDVQLARTLVSVDLTASLCAQWCEAVPRWPLMEYYRR